MKRIGLKNIIDSLEGGGGRGEGEEGEWKGGRYSGRDGRGLATKIRRDTLTV